MFDLIGDLPVHILVIHAVVVLIPLMFLVTLAFCLRPKWRPGLPWAILGNLVAVGCSLVAKESGQHLQARLSKQLGSIVAKEHGERGDVLPYFAIALLAASVIAWFLARQQSIMLLALAVLLVLITGAGATYWVYLTGDSGSRAVWEDTIRSTESATT